MAQSTQQRGSYAGSTAHDIKEKAKSANKADGFDDVVTKAISEQGKDHGLAY